MTTRFHSSRVPKDFEPNRFTRALARRADLPLIDLTQSNPTGVGIPELEKDLSALLSTPSKYDPNPRGDLAARRAVAQVLKNRGREIDPELVWLTAGTSEAYSFLIRLLADPADEILIPTASYPLFRHLVEMESVKVREYALTYTDRWTIDLDDVREKITPRTRALILVNPNNPTGHFVTKGEAEALQAFCGEKGIAILADEVFWECGWGDTPYSFAQESEALTFVLGGVSKLFGLPQWKLSWIYMNGPQAQKEALSAQLDWILDLYLPVSVPIQSALSTLIEVGQRRTEAIKKRVLANNQFVDAYFSKSNTIQALPIAGGWSKVLRLSDGVDEEELVLELIEKRGVLFHPGYFFDLPFPSSLVLSLLPSQEDLERGFEALRSSCDLFQRQTA